MKNTIVLYCWPRKSGKQFSGTKKKIDFDWKPRKKRQAFLRQEEAASILRAMNQRPASDRPRVVLADDAVAERPARQQHQAGKAAVGNRETPEQQRARLQSQALRIKIFGKMNLKWRDQLGFAIRP
jgi:hypothetical protein